MESYHGRPRGTASVVVADDETVLAEVLARGLRRDGFQVFTAGDGDEALESVLDHKPDAVLTDMKMPYKTGAELCRELKARAETHRTAVIIMSSLPRGAIPDCGADAYIRKPFTRHELVTLLQKLLKAKVI